MPSFTELAPGVRRLVAPNPSMMTGPGTNTYLIGSDAIAVLDPGPVIDSHLNAIQEIGAGAIRWVQMLPGGLGTRSQMLRFVLRTTLHIWVMSPQF